jgi:ABC-2 type transport system permease protein
MMAATPARAVWLLTRLRLSRLLNQITTVQFRAARKHKSRSATPARRRLGAVLAVLMGALMMFSFSQMAHQTVLNLQCQLAPASQCVDVAARQHRRVDTERAAQELAAAPFAAPVAQALALQLSVLFLVSVLLPLGSRELAHADWDLEWLVTLPVRRSTLLWGRLLERTVNNPTGWLALAPPCALVAWFSGFHWSAPLWGVLGAAALLPMAALLRTLADTGLRMTLAPSGLRNLQAFAALASMPFLYLAIAFGNAAGDGVVFDLVRAAPAWLRWTPPGLVIAAINAPGPVEALGAAGLLLLEVSATLAAGMLLLRHQLRGGVVASGSRETARRPRPAPGQAAPSQAGARRWLPASPVIRRELRLLSRDRNFLVQSLLLPVVIVGSQFLINGKLNSIAELGTDPTLMATIAFGIGAYMLMLSAFQTLNNEGQVLWMLFTFPREIESVLKEKAQLWALLALSYPLAIFALGAWFAPSFQWRTVSLFVIVLAGIPVFSVIAVALGVFACDPLAQDVRTKVRPSYLYLYMLLASLYGYAIYTSVWSQKLVVMVLTAALAQALWQKARDELPYLLDASAAPPARVSTSDGLMAAMLFFVLQAIAGYLLIKGAQVPPGQAVVLAFGAAGALVYGLARLIYWRGKTHGVPRLLGTATPRALATGLVAGLFAAALGVGYMWLLRHSPLWGELALDKATLVIPLPWMGALALVAAPLCEEFIFRGLIFGGLSRSMKLLPAMVLSAAVFAIVHPPASMLPVFVLGLCTAWAYQRSKALIAPMLVHAIYNGVVIAAALAAQG